MQVYLPQDRQSRITFGISKVSNTKGVSVGYAYMRDDDNNAAFTVAIGRAGSETAIQGSFGFEFGGSRIPAFKAVPELALAAPAIPDGTRNIPEEEYASLLMAQVQQEELEEYAQQSDDRYAEQRVLIDAMQDELDARESGIEDIERLKREQAAIKAADEARAARRAAVREKLLKKAGEKTDG